MPSRSADEPQLRARLPLETHYCTLEGKDFPIGEFFSDPHWGLVHDVVPEHTSTGRYVRRPVHHRKRRVIDPPARVLG
jgi:hypothetical protein